jgi:steroid delta-isomerase-like uncharacterized protein
MSTRTPAEVGRLWFEEMWNRRDAGLLRELMAPGATGFFEGGRTMTGPDDFLAFQREFLDAVPDLRLEVVKTLAEGDDVCVHWRASGNHCGPGLGCVPSGKDIGFEGITWLTVKDGRIVAGQDFWNLGGLLKSIGAILRFLPEGTVARNLRDWRDCAGKREILAFVSISFLHPHGTTFSHLIV